MQKNYKTTEKVLDFCKAYIDEHGYAPTVREIGKGVGISSTSSVHRHIHRLFEEGKFMTEHPGDPRAFRISENQNVDSTGARNIDKDGLLHYINEEFPGVIDTHWNWDLLENIIDYAASIYNGKELINFLVNIIPEVTYEEYVEFMQ